MRTCQSRPQLRGLGVHFERAGRKSGRIQQALWLGRGMSGTWDAGEVRRQFLSQLSRLVKSGGQLILTSPYTWSLEYTPLDEWIGGCAVNGLERSTLGGLKEALLGEFTLVTTRDLPFLIREHARKFQWSVAQASVWLRL